MPDDDVRCGPRGADAHEAGGLGGSGGLRGVGGLELTATEAAMLAGDEGPGVAMAMRIVVALAAVRGATRLRTVTGAHIDSCLYHGRAGLDFARRLVALGARVRVPTTLNVGSLDLLHPGTVRAEATHPELLTDGRALMDAYRRLGARATWTCAPYQVDARPALGEHVAWAESNAIVFANSVLGARTDRYGDFLDICAAITARVPDAGLHTDDARRATLVLDVRPDARDLLVDPAWYAVLGLLVGERAGSAVCALVGLPSATTEDDLKALGATAASSGGVGLFHAVGLTPEAPTLAAVAADTVPVHAVTAAQMRAARESLCTGTAAGGVALDAVSLGTPHASLAELAALAQEVQRTGGRVHDRVEAFVSTGRGVLALADEAGVTPVLREAGWRIVTDTCTYVVPVLAPGTRVVMTNSGKWAHYAPGNLGVDVVLGTLRECVASASAGRVVWG